MHYYISITVDTDPDDTTITYNRNKFEWNGLHWLAELRNSAQAHGGIITWFVRADNQIAQLFGSHDYLLQQYSSFWDMASKSGDEIALHPHLCERDESDGSYLPLRDPKKCCEQLEHIHAALDDAGHHFKSIRIGESTQSNELIQCIDGLGYVADSTAIPGRVRQDLQRCFDWSSTPNKPYHPSLDDYRIPGKPSLSLLEVPMTTALFKADYDTEPKLRYMSLSYRPDIFAQGFDRFVGHHTGAEMGSIVFVIHPGEIFGPERLATQGGLYSYDIKSVHQNLESALGSLASSRASYSFVQVSELALLGHQKNHWK